MSKIQSALRRIRESKAAQGGEKRVSPQGDTPAASDETVARLAIRPDTRPVDEGHHSGHIVEVHRDKLREAGLLAPEAQERVLADQYRLIKRPLLNNALGRNVALVDDGNLIMVSSALSGDGKTFNCINLALSMSSEKDISVLLVDADVAKPHISRIFGVADQPGLIDLLADESLSLEDVVLSTDVPGLSLLPAGQIHAQATELLASKRMGDVVHQLSKRYANRIVLFDSPPLLITPESRVLASHMGQIAMVVCAGRTPQQAVIDAVACIDESKATNLILNQRSGAGLAGNEYGYGYGYGYPDKNDNS